MNENKKMNGSQKMPWKLDNAETRHRKHPVTYDIPTKAERNSLKKGQAAKVVFIGRFGGERMWVEVVEVLGEGKYRGILANLPLCVPGLSMGDRVDFEAKHVIDINEEIEEEEAEGETKEEQKETSV